MMESHTLNSLSETQLHANSVLCRLCRKLVILDSSLSTLHKSVYHLGQCLVQWQQGVGHGNSLCLPQQA